MRRAQVTYTTLRKHGRGSLSAYSEPITTLWTIQQFTCFPLMVLWRRCSHMLKVLIKHGMSTRALLVTSPSPECYLSLRCSKRKDVLLLQTFPPGFHTAFHHGVKLSPLVGARWFPSMSFQASGYCSLYKPPKLDVVLSTILEILNYKDSRPMTSFVCRLQAA